MANVTVDVKKRSVKGSKNLKNIRVKGDTPGIIYGHNDKYQPEMIQLNESKLKRALEKGNKMFDIKGLDKNITAMVTEVQVNEINDEILHIDFQRVEKNDELNLKIPIIIKGIPEGAKIGGRLQVFLHDMRIACTTDSFIDEFILDVSPMNVLDRLTLGDIDLPDGVRAVGIPTTTVCIVLEAKGSKKKTDDAQDGDADDKGKGK